MKRASYHVLGVMSGTSLDGIDIAEIFFDLDSDGAWNYRFGVSETIAYPEIWKNQLKNAVHFSETALLQLNETYTAFLAEVISEYINRHTISEIDAVCSHGHTILHQPEKGHTLQIGNLPIIAELLNETVVCDFRVQDVALGGQGAPLVPMGDALLFSEYEYCLNLGGFANCSFISARMPPEAPQFSRLPWRSELEEGHEKSIAYDICPINIVMNPLAEQKGLPYDNGGKIARNGMLDTTLLAKLDALPFYKQSPPKSLGLEWVQKNVEPIIYESSASIENKLHTLVVHMAKQLAAQFKEGSAVLVTGGGSYNTFLLECVRAHKDLNLVVPEPKLVEYKEALIFGLLGVLRLRNEVNCLASVTGAKRNHSSGLVYRPK